LSVEREIMNKALLLLVALLVGDYVVARPTSVDVEDAYKGGNGKHGAAGGHKRGGAMKHNNKAQKKQTPAPVRSSGSAPNMKGLAESPEFETGYPGQQTAYNNYYGEDPPSGYDYYDPAPAVNGPCHPSYHCALGLCDTNYHGVCAFAGSPQICKPGWWGLTEEEHGGAICNRQCPDQSKCAVEDECDYEYGGCVGSTAGPCKTGWWGAAKLKKNECTIPCNASHHCALEGCDYEHGMCVFGSNGACEVGWFGVASSENAVNESMWACDQECAFTSDTHCVVSQGCILGSGGCQECESGWEGEFCTEPVTQT